MLYSKEFLGKKKPIGRKIKFQDFGIFGKIGNIQKMDDTVWRIWINFHFSKNQCNSDFDLYQPEFEYFAKNVNCSPSPWKK